MPSAVETIIAKEVAGPFTTRESVVTVAAAPTQILRQDPERVGWVLINTGAVRCFLGFRESSPSAETLPLQADGGGASANIREDFVLPTFPMFGVVLAGTSTVYVIEIVRVGE